MVEGYILIWHYSDRSGEGHFSILFTEREKDILEIVLDTIGDPSKEYAFIKTTKTIDLSDRTKAP